MNTIIKGIRGRKRQQLVEFDVDIDIDMYVLAAELGRKALANKSGKSHAIGGCITVSVRGEPTRLHESGDPGPQLLAAMLPRVGKPLPNCKVCGKPTANLKSLVCSDCNVKQA
jgi:hypothetical protein